MGAHDATTDGRRPPLEFIDSIRGLASISVAVCHSYLYSVAIDARGLGGDFGWAFQAGAFGVTVFIVLSGFVLTLPLTKSSSLTFRGGLAGFIKRRGRRILPPYYAALILFAILILVIPGLDHRSGSDWDSKVPVTWHALVTHLLVIQNLGATHDRIDGPMWSVATEFQLYLVLAFVIIPIWRYLGIEVAALLGLIVGYLLNKHFPAAHTIYLGVFTFGAVAAKWSARGGLPSPHWRNAGLLILMAAVILYFTSFGKSRYWLDEAVVGAGVATLLVWLVRTHNAGGTNMPLRVLSDDRLVTVGLFSYSIYLIHSPLIAWANLATRHIAMPGLIRTLLTIVIVIPVTVAVSRVFYLLVERHFLSGHQAAVAVVAEQENQPAEKALIR